MNTWNEVTLEQVTTRIGDGLHGTPKYDDNGEYFFINGNNLSNGKIIIKEETKRISANEYNKIKKELSDRTVFVAINGTLGNIGLYNGEKIALGKSACYLNIKRDVEKNYIRYVLEDDHFQQYAQLFATGATIKNLGLKAIRDYKFKLPPHPIQKRIADILSAYDDLIENNLKRIKLLEELAQRTYEEWFVKFRVNGEQLPIDEGTGLPVGWEKRKIGDVCEKITDGTHDSPKPSEGGIKLITGKHLLDGKIDFDSAYCISTEDHEKIKQRSGLKKGDILFSNIGTLGNVAMVNEDFEYSCKNMLIFRPNSESEYFLYSYLRNVHNKVKFLSQSSGSTQKFISLNYIRNYEDFLPHGDLIVGFNRNVCSYYQLVFNLHKQNEKLKESRDILLPRLMNGTITVTP